MVAAGDTVLGKTVYVPVLFLKHATGKLCREHCTLAVYTYMHSDKTGIFRKTGYINFLGRYTASCCAILTAEF